MIKWWEKIVLSPIIIRYVESLYDLILMWQLTLYALGKFIKDPNGRGWKKTLIPMINQLNFKENVITCKYNHN